MERRERFSLGLQHWLGRLAAVVTAPLMFLFIRLMGWRIRDLETVRNEVALRQWAHEGPWLVCANHLTMVDSLLISYGLASLGGHIVRFSRIPWNLPERDNFQRNLLLTVLCYLCKCLPVNRGGSRDELQKVLEKCLFLMERGQSIMIFPEGGRSRTGRVDRENYSYGVGRFIEECPPARIMLVYLRGDHQEQYSGMPRSGETFSMQVEALDMRRLEGSGLRRQREYARQVVERLARMEERWLASRR
jgi:hypothetical protein